MFVQYYGLISCFDFDIYFRSIFPELLVRLSSNIAHNIASVSRYAFRVSCSLTYIWFSTMAYLNVLAYTSFPEKIYKTTVWISAIVHTNDLTCSKLCSIVLLYLDLDVSWKDDS